MRHIKSVAVGCAMVCASISVASDVPKEWKGIYDAINLTILRNDVHGYMKWMDKSFVNIQHGQRTGYAAYEKMFADFLKPFSNIKAKAAPLSYARHGKDVIIGFHYTFSGNVVTKGKAKTIRFFEDGVDTWRKVDGKYREFVEKITKDGVISA